MGLDCCLPICSGWHGPGPCVSLVGTVLLRLGFALWRMKSVGEGGLVRSGGGMCGVVVPAH